MPPPLNTATSISLNNRTLFGAFKELTTDRSQNRGTIKVVDNTEGKVLKLKCAQHHFYSSSNVSLSSGDAFKLRSALDKAIHEELDRVVGRMAMEAIDADDTKAKKGTRGDTLKNLDKKIDEICNAFSGLEDSDLQTTTLTRRDIQKIVTAVESLSCELESMTLDKLLTRDVKGLVAMASLDGGDNEIELHELKDADDEPPKLKMDWKLEELGKGYTEDFVYHAPTRDKFNEDRIRDELACTCVGKDMRYGIARAFTVFSSRCKRLNEATDEEKRQYLGALKIINKQIEEADLNDLCTELNWEKMMQPMNKMANEGRLDSDIRRLIEDIIYTVNKFYGESPVLNSIDPSTGLQITWKSDELGAKTTKEYQYDDTNGPNKRGIIFNENRLREMVDNTCRGKDFRTGYVKALNLFSMRSNVLKDATNDQKVAYLHLLKEMRNVISRFNMSGKGANDLYEDLKAKVWGKEGRLLAPLCKQIEDVLYTIAKYYGDQVKFTKAAKKNTVALSRYTDDDIDSTDPEASVSKAKASKSNAQKTVVRAKGLKTAWNPKKLGSKASYDYNYKDNTFKTEVLTDELKRRVNPKNFKDAFVEALNLYSERSRILKMTDDKQRKRYMVFLSVASEIIAESKTKNEVYDRLDDVVPDYVYVMPYEDSFEQHFYKPWSDPLVSDLWDVLKTVSNFCRK